MAGFGLDSLIEIGASMVVIWDRPCRADPARRPTTQNVAEPVGDYPGGSGHRRRHLGECRLRRLREHPETDRARPHVVRRAGIAGAVIGIVGNQAVARYKMSVGRRISSATLIADARHVPEAGSLTWTTRAAPV